MILELGGGREIDFPDDMSDESAKRIGRLILVLEKRAQDAEAAARTQQADIDALRNEVRAAPAAPAHSNADVVAAIDAMRQDIAAGLVRCEAASAADRVLIEDEFGRSRSRVVRG